MENFSKIMKERPLSAAEQAEVAHIGDEKLTEELIWRQKLADEAQKAIVNTGNTE